MENEGSLPLALNPELGSGSIRITGKGADYIDVEFAPIEGATWYEVVWRRAVVGAIEGRKEVTGTTKATIDDLLPETEYVVNYRGANANGVGPYCKPGAKDATLKAPMDRPANWSWWTTVQAGSEIGITADEWNAFCGRINDFRVHCSLQKYVFATVTSGDVISAAIVNQAVQAMKDMDSSAVKCTVQPGDAISAATFIGLRNVLNGVG